MAKEIRTFTWCDICLAKGDHVEGTEVTITLSGLKPRLLALCETDANDIIKPLRDILEDVGQIISTTTKSPTKTASRRAVTESAESTENAESTEGELSCPACDKRYSVNSSLRNHLRTVHGLTLTQARAQYGAGAGGPAHQAFTADDFDFGADPSPAVPDAQAPKVLRATCDQPDCDVVYEYPTHKRPSQALGVHKARTHGIMSAKKLAAS